MTNTSIAKTFFLVLIILLASNHLYSGETIQKDLSKKKPERKITFKPPTRGAPTTKSLIGGGVRSGENSILYLSVLAPAESGLTVDSQPTLYWYQSDSTEFQFKFTLNKGFETIAELTFDHRQTGGIQKISLAEHNITLEKGVEYEWNVALIPDPERRIKDITSTGWMKFIEPDSQLSFALQKASNFESAYIYANNGVWYSALQAISEEIENRAPDPVISVVQAELLEQIGLKEIANFIRNQVSL